MSLIDPALNRLDALGGRTLPDPVARQVAVHPAIGPRVEYRPWLARVVMGTTVGQSYDYPIWADSQWLGCYVDELDGLTREVLVPSRTRDADGNYIATIAYQSGWIWPGIGHGSLPFMPMPQFAEIWLHLWWRDELYSYWVFDTQPPALARAVITDLYGSVPTQFRWFFDTGSVHKVSATGYVRSEGVSPQVGHEVFVSPLSGFTNGYLVHCKEPLASY